jgi:tetratricopeptide (TPR) repeat protein
MEASTAHAPDAALVSAVHAMTEGNPFFVGEIVRLLAAEGRLDRRGPGLAGLALPQGVREAVGRRLDALSEQCNRLLPVAAVIGRDFPLSVLERVAELPRTRILELLDEAASARVLTRPASALASYGFSHALIRETLYEEITTPARVRLHRRVGEELEQLHGADAGMHLAEIAHHFFQAAPGGDVDKAVRYCVRAAQRATTLLAYEEAAAHYERVLQALELDPQASGVDRGEILLGLGDAQSCSGERDKARATFERAAAYARAAGRADQLARAALGFGGRGEMGMPRDEPLRALLVEALEALGDGSDELRSTLLARLVGTAPYDESLAKRMEFSAESLALARRSGDEATVMKALAARGWAFLGPDHVAARLEVATELLAIAEKAGDKQWEFIGREYRQGIYLALGDMQAVDREIAAAERLAEEIRQPISRWFARWWKASRALCDGRFEEADRLRHEALAIGQSIQHPGAMAIFAGQGLWLSYERGGTETIFEGGFEFLLSYYPRATVALRAGEAMYYCLVDRRPEAQACFDALAAEDFTDSPRDEHWISSISGIAEVCAMLGDTRRAAMLYEMLLPFADRNCVHDLLRAYSGSAAHYLALLAACRGDLAAATGHFESALAMNKRMGAQPYVGRTLYEYARILLDKGGPDDRPRAAALLDECAAVSGAIGLDALQAKARALRDQAEAVRSVAPKKIIKPS